MHKKSDETKITNTRILNQNKIDEILQDWEINNVEMEESI